MPKPHTGHGRIEIVGTHQISDFECRFDMATRTVKIYEANVGCLGQRDTDLLWKCPGESPGYFEYKTLAKHSDRVRSFEFVGCQALVGLGDKTTPTQR